MSCLSIQSTLFDNHYAKLKPLLWKIWKSLNWVLATVSCLSKSFLRKLFSYPPCSGQGFRQGYSENTSLLYRLLSFFFSASNLHSAHEWESNTKKIYHQDHCVRSRGNHRKKNSVGRYSQPSRLHISWSTSNRDMKSMGLWWQMIIVPPLFLLFLCCFFSSSFCSSVCWWVFLVFLPARSRLIFEHSLCQIFAFISLTISSDSFYSTLGFYPREVKRWQTSKQNSILAFTFSRQWIEIRFLHWLGEVVLWTVLLER